MPNVTDVQTLPALGHRWSRLGPGGVPIAVLDRIIELVPGSVRRLERASPASTFPMMLVVARFRVIEASTVWSSSGHRHATPVSSRSRDGRRSP